MNPNIFQLLDVPANQSKEPDHCFSWPALHSKFKEEI